MSYFISLSTAEQMTARYRQNKETILKTEYQNQNILCISETFDRSVFDSVLAQAGCVGLRIYYGVKEDDKIHAIIVGVNSDNEDILPTATENTNLQDSETEDDEDTGIIENGSRCPDLCAPSSGLNP